MALNVVFVGSPETMAANLPSGTQDRLHGARSRDRVGN